jgi:arsenate reductase (thioredoxin)
MKKKILVLCTGNSCRSQIAEGYLRFFYGDSAEIFSAGVEAHGLNPRAVQVMAEDGVEISDHTSNLVDEYLDLDFDHIITVCDHAREVCPWIPGHAQRHHYNFPDPAKATGTEVEIMDSFRKTRDLIKRYCKDFAC